MVFSAQDVIVTTVAVTVWIHTAHESGSLATASLECAITPFFLLTMLAIASLHILYALIWFAPSSFASVAKTLPLRMLGPYPVRVFANLVAIGKAVQQITVTLWACEHAGGEGLDSFIGLLQAADFRTWSIAIALLLIGQVLNMGIYVAIGKDGVYYGFKLGRPVPWATGFPFNLGLRHPQYVGAMMSWAGIFALLAATPSTCAPFGVVLFGWSGLYCATAAHE